MSTVDAGGNNGVEGGKAKSVYAMDGWARFVVRQSYRGVVGEKSSYPGSSADAYTTYVLSCFKNCWFPQTRFELRGVENNL